MTTALWDDLAERLDPGNERPRLRADAELGEHPSRWVGTEAIVHAPGTPYLRLTAAEADLARQLDGDHTVADLAADDFDDPDGLSIDEVVALVKDLGTAGILDQKPIDIYAAVRDRLTPAATKRRRRIWRALKAQTIAFRHADAIAGAVYRHGGRLLFTWPAITVAAALAVGGLVALATGNDGTPIITTDISGGNALFLFALLHVALLLHELGHALAVKHAGRHVVRAGFQLYLGHPAFFVDSTDLAFATRPKRAVNAAAGPFVEAAVAGLAAVVAATTDLGIANDLNRFAALCYFNVALNLIPFIELDGYWLLTDLLETPRLRARSFALLRYDLVDRLRRRRPPFTPAERAVAAFGVFGLLFTAAALGLATFIWLPLAGRLLSAAWDAGFVGRAAVVLIVLLVAGPLAQFALVIARSAAAAVGRVVDHVRFRAQTRWRVEAATAIAALPHAGELNDDDLSALAGRVTRRRVPEGAAVVRQGEAADAFFVVRRGALEVVERAADDTERVIRRLGPGDSFGELGLVGGRPRTATVRATADSEVFVLDAGAFGRLLAPALGEPALLPTLGPALEVQALPPFRQLSLDEATLVAERGDWLDVAADTAIVTQGDAGDGFYVLVSGQAAVERDGSVVAQLRAGDHFGEVALLEGARRNATVRAATRARLLRVDHDTFHALVAAAVAQRAAVPSTSDRTLGSEYA